MPSAAWRHCENMNPHIKVSHYRQTTACMSQSRADTISTHQLNEECRLAQRLGCWVREVSDRAALPLLWCGKTAGENTLFILTARWGQTPCSLSNTWWREQDIRCPYRYLWNKSSYFYLSNQNKSMLCPCVHPTLRAVLCRLCIVSLRWRNRKGQELMR